MKSKQKTINEIIDLANKIHEESKNEPEYFYFDKNTDPRLVQMMLAFKKGDIFRIPKV